MAEIHMLDNQLTALSRKQIKIRSSVTVHKNEEIFTRDKIVDVSDNDDDNDLKSDNLNEEKRNQDGDIRTTECKTNSNH